MCFLNVMINLRTGGIFADGKETISNFSVAFRTKVCFNKKR